MKGKAFMIHRFGHHWRFEHPWIYGHPWGYEQGWLPVMLLSALTTVFLVALFIGLAWALLRWIIPYLKPIVADIFGMPPVDSPALEILRQRYAAGEIDAVTFEQMRERLEASYRRGSNGLPADDNSYPRETWIGYRETFPSPGSRGQGSARMAEQERYPSETER
jgi:uncharacterized membrane protein